MNIGFHYFVTKTLAVRAGFTPGEAQLIAYACQYVDDATDHHKLRIRNLPEPTYERMEEDWFDPTCTAHKGINNILYNFRNIRKKILMPFHFLPGSHQKEGNYITEADGVLANELVNRALNKLREAPDSNQLRKMELIRLGIALHTYEDTFAHQNFSARNSQIDNGVKNPRIRSNDAIQQLPSFIRLQGIFGYSIGHGLLYTYPDRFRTEIAYIDGRGNDIYIDTTERFIRAARRAYDLLRKYTGTDDEWEEILLPITRSLRYNWTTKKNWIKNFTDQFSGMNYRYSEKTWRNQAIGPDRLGRITYKGDMKWFWFHQAAWEQRVFVTV